MLICETEVSLVSWKEREVLRKKTTIEHKVADLSVSCTVDDDWFLGGARELHPLVYDK